MVFDKIEVFLNFRKMKFIQQCKKCLKIFGFAEILEKFLKPEF